MIQIIAATFEDGVFKPDQQPVLPDNARVRLLVESGKETTEEELRGQAWASLEELWRTSTFNSHGERLSRDELHERR